MKTIAERILDSYAQVKQQKRRVVIVVLTTVDIELFHQQRGRKVVEAALGDKKPLCVIGAPVTRSFFIHAGRGRDRFADV